MRLTLRNATAAAALVAACAMSPAAAHENHAPSQKPTAAQGARINLADTPLLDQDGRSVRLKSDVIGSSIAIVGFVYTSCTTVCPVVSAMLSQTQAKLGARAGRDVKLVTITVDPVRDTPARMKAHGKQHGAGPGWTLVTGPKPQVDEALKAFDAYTPNFNDHPPVVYVGDAKAGKWLRFYGFPSPDQLMSAVGELTAARKAAAAS